MTEEELLRNSQSGDLESFSRLLQLYQSFLYGMILRQLEHKQDAEDVFQEVALQVFRHVKQFRGECKLSTWLYAIALNRCRNHLRRRKSDRRFVPLEYFGSEDEEKKPSLQWADSRPTPEEQSVRRSEMESVLKALETLSQDQKNIFVLHYFQYQSLEEISRRLQKPLATVKVYLHRARKAIYKNMAEPPAPRRSKVRISP